MAPDSFARYCRKIARRFLLTAVLVDDELFVSTGPPAGGELKRPERSVSARPAATSAGRDSPPPWPIDIDPITRSFARHGMVCGVVTPQEGQGDYEDIARAVARADIVILDWWLSRTPRANALPLLKRILGEDQPHRLRLIAFYTGEPDHRLIREEIAGGLGDLDAPDRPASTEEDGAIDFGACRIVVYAKPDSRTLEQSAIVAEEDLAHRLVGDFASMVQGLLPGLVLTALAAVRENVHRVLAHFGRDLDPAFLTHRACLPLPADSEQHIVEQIASELHGVMNDAVGGESPAGIEAIRHWLGSRFEEDCIEFGPGKEMSHAEVLEMLEHGIGEKHGPFRKGGRDYHLLSQGFSGDTENGRELDHRLASAMDFRQVVVDTPRQLSMGTVVRCRGDGSAMLLCATPRCDSVRLTEKSSFVFLPLADPTADTAQVVVPTGQDKHRRMAISMNPVEWLIRRFDPDPDRQCVLADGDGPDQIFVFRDADDREYEWVGELKPEFAQSLAQLIADRMSRIPLNRSEWLRRSARSG
ncbi:MAG: response regulator receiver domain [Gemmatimonadetes bacterium]|nr:response regulator receiver domain [Gemmatimonadota bacterium]